MRKPRKIDLESLKADMDRYIHTFEIQKRKLERIVLTAEQFNAYLKKEQRSDYRGVRLEVV